MSGDLMPGRYELKARTLAAMDCQNKHFTGAYIFLLYAFFSLKLNQSHVGYLHHLIMESQKQVTWHSRQSEL